MRSRDEHREPTAAVADRDEARAQRVMRAHTEHMRTSCHERGL